MVCCGHSFLMEKLQIPDKIRRGWEGGSGGNGGKVFQGRKGGWEGGREGVMEGGRNERGRKGGGIRDYPLSMESSS